MAGSWYTTGSQYTTGIQHGVQLRDKMWRGVELTLLGMEVVLAVVEIMRETVCNGCMGKKAKAVT